MTASPASLVPWSRPATGHPPVDDRSDIPFCAACDTAEHLAFEDFVPSRLMPDGQVCPGTVSYLCMECDQYSSHAVPDAWQPPAWHWYV